MKYGLQVYTVRDVINADFDAAFKAIKKIGYDYVELPGLFGKNPADIKSFMDKVGLTIASVMFSPAELESKLDDIVATCKVFNCRYVVCPHIEQEFRTVEGYSRLAGILDMAAEKLKAASITLAYHNHAFEFDTLADGICGYEILFSNTKSLCFEPDVYWFAFASKEPLEIMRKLKDRMPLLHLKDMAAGEDKKFCEVGHGVLPMKQIISLAREMAVKYAFVEQDSNWAASPMESTAASLKGIVDLTK